MRLFSAQKLKECVSEPPADSSLWSFLLGDSLHVYEGRVRCLKSPTSYCLGFFS